MILRNKFFVAIAFCCSVNTSIAMDPNDATRIISLETVVHFAQACLPESIITGASIREWRECEDQVEKIGESFCICPQLFLCNFLDGEFVIKAVQERAWSEIDSTKYIYEFLSTREKPEAVDIIFCTFYAIFREGRLLEAKHIKDSRREIRTGDWVLEFMPRAPGIQLGKLLDPAAASFRSCTDNMFQKIGEAIHYLNFELNILHNDLHCGNIIVDPDTMKVSFIDFDKCENLNCCFFQAKTKIENKSDSALLFFTVFYMRFFIPIMEGNFQATEDDEKVLHFMHLLLSSSLGEGRRVYIQHNCSHIFQYMFDSMVSHAQYDATTGTDIIAYTNIPNGILDQKIDTLCKCLKRFIVFFKKEMVSQYYPIKEDSYIFKAINLFFCILLYPHLDNLKAIRSEEKRLGIPEMEWHTSLLLKND
jgi:serine/threonine protein kinase